MKDSIYNYSNPKIVLKNAKKIYGNDVMLDFSTHKDKKYMILNPENNKWIHFGKFGQEDYTKHNDEKRREAFLKRNHAWASADKYTPAYAAYYLLW